MEIIGQCIAGIESLDDEISSGAYGHFMIEAEPDTAIDGASKTEATRESPPDKRTQQACNVASLVRAAKIIADKLELGAEGDELALCEVLRAAEGAAGELLSESREAAEAAGAGAVSSG